MIFCYQIHNALNKLMGDETVDSTAYIPISDLESPPIITFCPIQPESMYKLAELGYDTSYKLVQGNDKELE